MERFVVRNGDVALSVLNAGPADAAALPILCVHGWPELAWSWRHQLAHFAAAGRRIAALDVRGYGESDKPAAVEAYTMAALTSDVAAIIDALGGRAILFGHDWGAPIVWQTAVRYPDKVAAVAGLSVPYTPTSDTSFIALIRTLYEGRFFYQLYFQTPGVAEAEFAGDPDTLLKVYYGISGEGMRAAASAAKGPDSDFLTGLVKPDTPPGWLSAEDLAIYNAAFAKGGWTGPLNRYRAQELDHEARAGVVGKHVIQPAAFIAGTLDPVRRFIPGHDGYADAGRACDDFRGTTLIEGAGHWVQQEAPEAVNAALGQFVDGL
ncbi:alpha/beta fold hydrolase [Sphingomonas sp.]|uniref:alpha/beta fold hydrolase n=1 Tax=Sphingomonas sp. TaxID=28214 RepID=UPI003CC5AB7B